MNHVTRLIPRATSDAVTTGATVTRLEDCANSGAVCHVIT